MKPAELKTIRESLGLTIRDIAAIGSVSPRTVQNWENGRGSVSADIEEYLLTIDQYVDVFVSQSVIALAEHFPKMYGITIDKVTLFRYKTKEDLWEFRPEMVILSLDMYAAMLARLRRALFAEKGLQSTIVYMEPDKYKLWLNGRHDDELERWRWAASLDG